MAQKRAFFAPMVGAGGYGPAAERAARVRFPVWSLVLPYDLSRACLGKRSFLYINGSKRPYPNAKRVVFRTLRPRWRCIMAPVVWRGVPAVTSAAVVEHAAGTLAGVRLEAPVNQIFRMFVPSLSWQIFGFEHESVSTSGAVFRTETVLPTTATGPHHLVSDVAG